MKRRIKSRDWLTRWVLSSRYHSNLSVQQGAHVLAQELGNPLPLVHVRQIAEHVSDALATDLLDEGGELPPPARWPMSVLWLALRLSPALGLAVFGWMLRRQTRRMLSALPSLRGTVHRRFQQELIPMQLSAQAAFARLDRRDARARAVVSAQTT